MPAGNAYPSGHLVPSPFFLGLAYAPIVETKFLELAMSLLDFFALNTPWYWLLPRNPTWVTCETYHVIRYQEKRDGYQKHVTTGQIDGQTDSRQSYPYVPVCFAGDTKPFSIIF